MASGFSRRFGGNKLLYEIGGKQMFEYGLEALSTAKRQLAAENINLDIIVVTSYEKILKRAEEGGIKAEYNSSPEDGITSSIHLGLADRDVDINPDPDINEAKDIAGFMFFVADQPYMKAESIANLVRIFCNGNKGIASVISNGRRSSPAIFDKKYKSELLDLTGDTGGSSIIKRNQEDIAYVEVERAEIVDIDRIDDLIE
jgi:molybdenum cofactor cytidylyltransferase